MIPISAIDLRYRLVLLGAALLIPIGLAAGFFPWEVTLLGMSILVFLVWGLLDVRVALGIILILSFFVEADAMTKTVGFKAIVDVFDNPVEIAFPGIYFAAAAILVPPHLLSRLRSRATTGKGSDGLMHAPLLLLGYAVITLLWSPNFNWTVFWLLFLVANIGVYQLLCWSFSDEKTRKGVLYAVAIAGALNCLAIIAFCFRQQVIINFAISENLRFYVITGGSGVITDPTGTWGLRTFLGDYHMQAGTMNVVCAVAIGLLMIERRQALRVVLWTTLFLAAVVGVLIDVRAGLLGFIGMMVFIFLGIRRFRRRFITGITLCGMGFVILSIAVHYAITVISGTTSLPRILSVIPFSIVEVPAAKAQVINWGGGGMPVPVERIELWKAAIKGFWESGGWGVGTENARSPQAPAPGPSFFPHSIYLAILLDYGYVGVVFWIVLAMTMFSLVKRLVCCLPADADAALALALFGGLVAVAIQGVADFLYNDPLVWSTLGLACGAAAAALGSGLPSSGNSDRSVAQGEADGLTPG